MSKFLIDEKPIVILPSLVKAFGFCEAAFIQKLHYFLEANAEKKRNFIDGRFWSHGTYAEWAETLNGIFAESTIRKAVAGLEKKGLLISTTEYNQHPFDRTKWYSIDYEVLAAFERSESPDKREQNDLLEDSETIRYEIADESATSEQMNALPDSTSYKELNGQLSGQLNGQLSGRDAASPPTPPADAPDDGSAPPCPADKPAKRTERATRIPADFQLTDEMRAWAEKDGCMFNLEREHENFCDYWTAKEGKEACKKDWIATWRRWMRKANDDWRRNNKQNFGGRYAENQHGNRKLNPVERV